MTFQALRIVRKECKGMGLLKEHRKELGCSDHLRSRLGNQVRSSLLMQEQVGL